MTRRATITLMLCWVCLASCKRHASGESVATERARPSGVTGATGSARSGSDAGAAESRDGRRRRWHGTYRSESATIFVPPEWKGVRWSVPATSSGLGDGAMDIAIDVGGRVSGSLDGPLGPARLDGVVSGSTITASVLRRDPSDHGYGGTLIATVAGEGIQGTMNLSLGEAGAVRSATFSLSSVGLTSPGSP